MNKQETCSGCGSKQFLLESPARIICAGCHTPFGTWMADDQPGFIVNVPTLPTLLRRR